jgi:ankyrin repeat protein
MLAAARYADEAKVLELLQLANEQGGARALATCAAPLFGETPLHLASHSGTPSLLALLASYGADLHATDRMGWAPLHYAAYVGPAPNVDALLALGANRDARTGAADGARTAQEVATRAKRTPEVLAALTPKLATVSAGSSHTEMPQKSMRHKERVT